MRILQVNTVYGIGSTGKIAKDIHDKCVANGIECVCVHRRSCKGSASFDDTIEVGTFFSSRVHGFLARFTMFKGCFSYFSTLSALKAIKAYNPDIIHLHNLHGSYINIGLLMRYIKRSKIKVIFTLHDCWAFTAICSHFTIAKCDKWQNGCGNCVQRKKYSSAPIDFTKKVWKVKRDWFLGVEDMTIVTPSNWLANLVDKSFLKDYTIEVINNGIDLDVFTPTPSDFKEKYGICNKKIVLAVAFGWGYEKGLDVIIELSKRLSVDYQIVIVGADDGVDKQLPKNVISIHRTHNQVELAKIYTAADVFINPTREEVLGLVNIEALACGTSVVTFKTGGSPEIIDETCGVAIEVNDIDGVEREVVRICTQQPYTQENCLRRAKSFDKNIMLEKYLTLYRK